MSKGVPTAEDAGIRIQKYLEKYDRMEEQFITESIMPGEFWNCLKERRSALLDLQKKFKRDIVSPFEL